MRQMTIWLPEDHVEALAEKARRLGVTPEELVRASVAQLLSEGEDEFRRAADYVLRKNANLYRRLA